MQKISTFAILLLCLFALLSCEIGEEQAILKSSLAVSQQSKEIPELLQRYERIQQNKEWENVQNRYAGFKQEILAGDQKALLNLAQLILHAIIAHSRPNILPLSLLPKSSPYS
ncbi:MAG: hypothetical protein AAFP82_19310 [Bacteroidota bacterium]